MKQNIRYYTRRTVQIRSRKEPNGTLPNEQRLRSFLLNFGTILDLKFFRILSGAIIFGRPNTAIIVFASPSAATNAIQSSDLNEDESFWQTASILAHSPQLGPAMKNISKIMYPGLTSNFNGQSSSSKSHQQPAGRRPGRPSSGVSQPPAKRHRANNLEGGTEDTSPREYIFISDSSRETTPIAETESPERMRARIAQLEAELDSARIAYDTAMSEQDVAQLADQAEQNRLRAALEAALAQNSVLLKDNVALRKERASAKEGLKRKAKPGDTVLGDMEARMKQLRSGLRRLESDLVLTREQLRSTQTAPASTQASFKPMEGRYASTR
ncbi:hypothetical protein ACGC1H_003084 [Rhizoctonia solani]|uniref:RRM domain-containing protein n=1 Tax=Rhizoctonia solani TaxID=456999 RepID=A0A8H3GDU0_9AGAM|nr:unnamed protein product [Rhizoctonia solani]